jgi:hypothetical protein
MTTQTATSALRPMFIPKETPVYVCISGTAYYDGTTNFQLIPVSEFDCIKNSTNTGIISGINPFQSPSIALMELRRLCGFTWDELATLFNVSRRSLHFWASGKPLNAPNEDHLRQVLDILHQIDTGNAQENRSRLLSKFSDGITPFELLTNKEYQAVIERLGSRTPRVKRINITTSRHVTAFNTPRPPYELVDALPESVHIDKGRLLKSTSVKAKRKT